MTDQQRPRAFDEQAALDDLERLAERIEQTRRQRDASVAEFDEFVKTFRRAEPTPPATAASGASNTGASASAPDADRSGSAAYPSESSLRPPAARSPTHDTDVADAVSGVPELPDVMQMLPSEAELEQPDEANRVAAIREEPSAFHSERSGGRPIAWTVWGGAAAAVLLIGLLLWRPWQDAPAEPAPRSTDSPGAAVPAPTGLAPKTPPPGSTAAAPAASRAVNVVLSNSRPVWLRVTVDGKKIIERELAAGQRLQFGGDRTIAVRAGDAGAVRVTVDGRDAGLMGAEGQPASRTFTAPDVR